MEASHQLILLGSVLVLLSIFAGVFSARLGAPLLLIFLGLVMLAGHLALVVSTHKMVGPDGRGLAFVAAPEQLV